MKQQPKNQQSKTQQLIALRNGEVFIENANEYWSDKDSENSKKMFESGYGISDIALSLKRTEVSVTCHLQNMGLFAPQCRPRRRVVKEGVCLCKKCKKKDCKFRNSETAECAKCLVEEEI